MQYVLALPAQQPQRMPLVGNQELPSGGTNIANINGQNYDCVHNGNGKFFILKLSDYSVENENDLNKPLELLPSPVELEAPFVPFGYQRALDLKSGEVSYEKVFEENKLNLNLPPPNIETHTLDLNLPPPNIEDETVDPSKRVAKTSSLKRGRKQSLFESSSVIPKENGDGSEWTGCDNKLAMASCPRCSMYFAVGEKAECPKCKGSELVLGFHPKNKTNKKKTKQTKTN